MFWITNTKLKYNSATFLTSERLSSYAMIVSHSLRHDRVVCLKCVSLYHQVSYDRRLVGLVQEVMHLSIMGNKIHPDIVETAKHAHKFMRQAKALEEVGYSWANS